jgi:hypothetical protein
LTDIYIGKHAIDLLKESEKYLNEIELQIEKFINRYYSAQIEEINSNLFKHEQKISESPSFYKLIQREKEVRSMVLSMPKIQLRVPYK